MYESLVCYTCGREWSRKVVRGRKPHSCPPCRPAPATPRRPAHRPTSSVEYTDGGRVEAGFTREASDCTVRALATATDSTYKQAHTFMATNGRRNGKGHAFASVLARHDYAVLGCNILPANIFNRARGLRTALLRNPFLRKGTWIIQMPRHVVTLRNGVLLDSFDSSAKEFRNAWLVTPL